MSSVVRGVVFRVSARFVEKMPVLKDEYSRFGVMVSSMSVGGTKGLETK